MSDTGDFAFVDPGLFGWTLVVAAIAFILLLIMTLRARKPLRIPALKMDAGAGEGTTMSAFGWVREKLKEFLSDLKTLINQNEDAYSTPWVLMIGDQNTGKSSLGASLVSSPRLRCLLEDPPDRPEDQGWWSFDQGMLIDVDSLVRQTSEKELVAKLMRVRPERPLDAVLLCVSASELLTSTERELLDLALTLHEQLSRFQQQFNFTFPVYVLVTKADEIPGFHEFCSTRTGDELRQMFGWSNPASLESGYNPDWVAEALEHLRETLREVLLGVAAEAKSEIDGSLDAFYLFPRRLESITRPLTRFLAQIFKVNPYQANFFFRGIYFSGLSEREACAEESPAPTVAFLDQLFSEKIFSEHNLARPIKGSMWSRQQEIRRLQKIFIGVFTVLVIGLGLSSIYLQREVREVRDILTTVDYESRGNTSDTNCTDYETIQRFLSYISTLDSGLSSPFIPMSWFDNRHHEAIAELVSESTFNDVVFRAFDCKMQKLETRLTNLDPPPLVEAELFEPVPELLVYIENYLREVIELYQAITLREHFVQAGTTSAQKLADLDSLLRILYGRGLPREAQRGQDAVLDILDRTNLYYKADSSTVNKITAGTSELVTLLDKRALMLLNVGGEMLEKMRIGTANVEDVRRFVQWMDWLDQEWLTLGGDDSVDAHCETIPRRFVDALTEIGKFKGFSSFLESVRAQFGASSCHNVDRAKLAALRLEPLGNLLEVTSSSSAANPEYQFSSNWKRERNYLDQLSRLDFMQLQPSGAFVCNAGATGWNIGQLEEAGQHMEEFVRYLQSDLGGKDKVRNPSILRGKSKRSPAAAATGAVDSKKVAPAAVTAKDSQDSTGSSGVATPKGLAASSVSEWPHVRIGRANLLKVVDQILSSAQSETTQAVRGGNTSASGAQVAVRQASVAFDQVPGALANLFAFYSYLQSSAEAQPLAMCVQKFASQQLIAIGSLADASSLLQPTQSRPFQLEQGAPVFLFGSETSPDNWWQMEMSRAQMVLSYATPYVSLLNSTKADYGGLGQQAQLAQYWGNSLAEMQNKLEFGRNDGQVDSLKQTLKVVAGSTLSNCRAAVDDLPATKTGIDFFSSRRLSVEKYLRRVCGENSQARGAAVAAQLAQEFRALQARFPFADKKVAREAELVRTRTFFLDYAANTDVLKNYLLADDGADSKKVNSQLNLFDGAVRFFNSHLAVEGPPVRLGINVLFRSHDSPGGENVALWKMGNGIEWLYRPPSPAASLSWYYGEPLEVAFKWPESLRPVADPGQSHLRINSAENQAQFSFDGNFALQRLIALHLYKGPLVGATAPEPIVLRFVVPVAVSGPAGKSRSGGVSGHVETTRVELFIELKLNTTAASGKPIPVFVPSLLPQFFPGAQ